MVPKDPTKQMKWLQPMLYKCNTHIPIVENQINVKKKSITFIHPYVNSIDRGKCKCIYYIPLMTIHIYNTY